MRCHNYILQLGTILLSGSLLTGCGEDSTPEQAAEHELAAVESADGVQVTYETWGSGETAVVFVHCWACNRQFWRHQIEPVVEAGYRVVAMDLPGHGESGSNREEWSVRGLAGDVEAVADKLGLERVILVGHSMGGPISLEVAARMPERALGVACVDTLHNADFEMPEGFADRLATQMEEDYQRGVDSFIPQMFRPGADPEVIGWVGDQAMLADHVATIALMRDFPGLDMPRLFESAGVPIRCINSVPAGGVGMPTAVETNRRYADFDVILMDNVGHYPQLVKPEVFNRNLLEVLAELSV